MDERTDGRTNGQTSEFIYNIVPVPSALPTTHIDISFDSKSTEKLLLTDRNNTVVIWHFDTDYTFYRKVEIFKKQFCQSKYRICWNIENLQNLIN